MKYISMIKEVKLWNAGYVQRWNFSKANSCEEARVEAVTEVARVCRGDKEIKDPIKLYKQLLTEHNGKPGEVFQFVPRTTYTTWANYNQSRFGYKDKNDTLRTNLRAHLNDSYERNYDTGYNNSVSGFHVFKIKIPMMIAAHILKHGQLSFMQVSERSQKLREYYYCDDLLPIKQSTCFTDNEEEWNNVCYNFSQHTFDLYRKKFRIRQELTNKGSHGLSYTTMWIAGWEQDPSGWDNFFGVRRKKPSQLETIQVADVMYKMMHE